MAGDHPESDQGSQPATPEVIHNPSPGVRRVETTLKAGEYILPLPEDKQEVTHE